MPFSTECSVVLEEAGPERVVGKLEWAPRLCTSSGVLHGGAIMTLADSLGAICAFLNLPEGASTSTIESKTNFFRAVRRGTLHATARPLHRGRSTIVVQTDMFDDDRKPVAHVVQTQAVIT